MLLLLVDYLSGSGTRGWHFRYIYIHQGVAILKILILKNNSRGRKVVDLLNLLVVGVLLHDNDTVQDKGFCDVLVGRQFSSVSCLH